MSIFAKNLVTRKDFENYSAKLSADITATKFIIANHVNRVNVMPDFVFEAAQELLKCQEADMDALELKWIAAERNFERGGKAYQTIV